LQSEMTMSVELIAERLSMGTRGHLNHLLYWYRRAWVEQLP